MGRPAKIEKMALRKVLLPKALVGQVELTLYSDAQGRIPYGAWTALLVPLLEAYLINVRAIGAANEQRYASPGSSVGMAAEGD